MEWWDCNHEAKGISGCPICDGSLVEKQRVLFLKARNEIFELKYKLDLYENKINQNDCLINQIKNIFDIMYEEDASSFIRAISDLKKDC